MPGTWCKRSECCAGNGPGGRGAAPRADEHCASCSSSAEKYKKDTGAYLPQDAAPMACRVRRLEKQAKVAHEHDRSSEYEAFNEKRRATPPTAAWRADKNKYNRALGQAGYYEAHNSRRRAATAALTEAVNKKLVTFLVEEARQGDEAYAVRADARANGYPPPYRARLEPVASFASVTPGLNAGAALLDRRPFYFCALSLDVFQCAGKNHQLWPCAAPGRWFSSCFMSSVITVPFARAGKLIKSGMWGDCKWFFIVRIDKAMPVIRAFPNFENQPHTAAELASYAYTERSPLDFGGAQYMKVLVTGSEIAGMKIECIGEVNASSADTRVDVTWPINLEHVSGKGELYTAFIEGHMEQIRRRNARAGTTANCCWAPPEYSPATNTAVATAVYAEVSDYQLEPPCAIEVPLSCGASGSAFNAPIDLT